LLDHRVPDGDVFLEVLSPIEPLDLTRAHHEVDFQRAYLPVARFEAHTFAVIDGLIPGTRDRIGDFYALKWRDGSGDWHRILDPLAMSHMYSFSEIIAGSSGESLYAPLVI
jgi:hypothetical protein